MPVDVVSPVAKPWSRAGLSSFIATTYSDFPAGPRFDISRYWVMGYINDHQKSFAYPQQIRPSSRANGQATIRGQVVGR